jgi:hypothetical protein
MFPEPSQVGRADIQVMHQNITKVAERGERLDALQDKTGESRLYLALGQRPINQLATL